MSGENGSSASGSSLGIEGLGLVVRHPLHPKPQATRGSWNPFTLQKLMARKRAKLSKPDLSDEALAAGTLNPMY